MKKINFYIGFETGAASEKQKGETGGKKLKRDFEPPLPV